MVPQATPRNPWQDNGRGELNESALSPPPEKRPRSYSPPLGNHVEQKTDLQESLLGQALEGGPTIHTTPTNNVQVRWSFSLSFENSSTRSRVTQYYCVCSFASQGIFFSFCFYHFESGLGRLDEKSGILRFVADAVYRRGLELDVGKRGRDIE